MSSEAWPGGTAERLQYARERTTEIEWHERHIDDLLDNAMARHVTQSPAVADVLAQIDVLRRLSETPDLIVAGIDALYDLVHHAQPDERGTILFVADGTRVGQIAGLPVRLSAWPDDPIVVYAQQDRHDRARRSVDWFRRVYQQEAQQLLYAGIGVLCWGHDAYSSADLLKVLARMGELPEVTRA